MANIDLSVTQPTVEPDVDFDPDRIAYVARHLEELRQWLAEQEANNNQTVPFPLLDPVGAWNTEHDWKRFGKEGLTGVNLAAYLFGPAAKSPSLLGSMGRALVGGTFMGGRMSDDAATGESPFDYVVRLLESLTPRYGTPRWNQ